MSGIFGIFSGKCCPDREVKKLRLWNEAYGSEGSFVEQFNSIVLGMSLEHFTKSPMPPLAVFKRDLSYAVIDCILYNREELCKEITNSDKMSDEELLFEFCLKFGYDALSKINGDFAGAIYDSKNKSLTLFRDHMGVRPLFYYWDNKSISFSTDIRGLISLEEIDASINREWFYRCVSGFPITGVENTEYDKIHCIAPASFFSFTMYDDEISVKKDCFWKLGMRRKEFLTFNKGKEKLRSLINDAISRRLAVNEGVVGAELSGGLDSSVIDILINRLGYSCKFFSWSVDPSELPMSEGDERYIIQDICKQEGIECQYEKRFTNIGRGTRLDEYIRRTGINMPDNEHAMTKNVFPSYVNTLDIYEASEFFRKEGVRMVFCGHGGDEGVSHRLFPYEMWYNHEYFHFWKYAYSLMKDKRFRFLRSIKYCYTKGLCEGRKVFEPFVMDSAANGVLKKSFVDEFRGYKMPPNAFLYSAKEYVLSGGSRSRLDVVALLGGYGGVHYVSPYLDYRVIDYAVSLPRHFFLRNNINRYIFREAFRDVIPSSLYQLRNKSSNSLKGFEKEREKKDETMREQMNSIISFFAENLDRSMWGDIIDLDSLTDFKKEDYRNISNVISALNLCYKQQILIKRVKGLE